MSQEIFSYVGLFTVIVFSFCMIAVVYRYVSDAVAWRYYYGIKNDIKRAAFRIASNRLPEEKVSALLAFQVLSKLYDRESLVITGGEGDANIHKWEKAVSAKEIPKHFSDGLNAELKRINKIREMYR